MNLRRLILELEPDLLPDARKNADVYIFSSEHISHIEIALRQGMWAVADIDPQQRASRITKAKQMEVGAKGLFYSSDAECFTVPFVVESRPQNRVVQGIWPGDWHFPFRIRPLGDLSRRISLWETKREWKTLQGVGNVTEQLRISRGMAFVESWLYESDWQLILQKLSDGPDERRGDTLLRVAANPV